MQSERRVRLSRTYQLEFNFGDSETPEYSIDPELVKISILQNNPDALFAVGYDSCIVAQTTGGVVVYSSYKIIDKLMESGMDLEGALDFFTYNIEGAYVGDYTPIFLLDYLIS